MPSLIDILQNSKRPSSRLLPLLGSRLDQPEQPAAPNSRLLPRMTEEDRRGILSQALDTSLSAVSRAGQAFDDTFGGRAIRGIATGKFSEAASLIPTAVGVGLAPLTLGLSVPVGLAGSWLYNFITGGVGDEKDRTTGRDLIQHYTGSDPGFLAGLAADILTDPSTFVGGGLTKAGKVLQRSGIDDVAKVAGKAGMGPRQAMFTSTLKDIASSPHLSDLQRTNLEHAIKKSGSTLEELSTTKLHEGFSLGLPFSEIGGKGLRVAIPLPDALSAPLRSQVGFPEAGDFAGAMKAKDIGGAIKSLKPSFTVQPMETIMKQADDAASKIRQTRPVAFLNRLFTGDALSAHEPEVQLANQAAMKDTRRDIYEAFSKKFSPAMDRLTDVPDVATVKGGQSFRQQMEFGTDPDSPARFLDALLGKEAPENVPYFARKEAGESIGSVMDEVLVRKQAAGLPTEEYTPKFFRWWTRGKVLDPDEIGTRAGMTRPFSDAHREEMLNLIPRGTKALDQAVQDPQIAKLYDDFYKAAPGAEEDAAGAALEKYVRATVQDMPVSAGEGTEAVRGTWSEARRNWLDQWLKKGHLKDERFQKQPFDKEFAKTLDEKALESYRKELKANNDAIQQLKRAEFRANKAEFREIDTAFRKSSNLADWIVGQKPDIFGHPVADAALFAERGLRQANLAEQHVRLLAKKAAKSGAMEASVVPKGMMRADKALEELGFIGKQMGVKASDQPYHRITDGSAISFLRKAEEAGHPYSLDEAVRRAEDEAMEAVGESGVMAAVKPEGEIAREELKNWLVPERLVKDMVDSRQVATSLRELELPMQRYRRATQFWKDLVTVGRFPAFFSRNYINAGYMNAAQLKMFDPMHPIESVRSIIQSYRDAHKVLRGEIADVTDIYPGKTAPEALQLLKAETLGNKLLSTPQMYVDTDIPNRVMGAPSPQQFAYEQLQHARPGEKPLSYTGLAKEAGAALKTTKPIKAAAEIPKGLIASIKGDPLPENIGKAIEGGKRLNQRIEGDHRLAAYIWLRRNGVEPVTAGRMVDDAHVSYSKSSRVERRYARGLIPFYTWPRQMGENVVRQTYANPAGPFAQFARAENRLADKQYDMPQHVASNAAIPLGDETYITNLADLPPELFNKLAAFGPGAIQRTLAAWGGMLNPIIKTPLEVATNTSLYDARDLRDKDSRLGRTLTDVGVLSNPRQVPIAVDQVLGLTPGYGTMVNMLGQATDTRKNFLERLVNIGTGVKLTSVTQQDRESALRKAIDQQLHGAPGIRQHSSIYVGDDTLLTENQRLLLSITKDIAAKARDRKKAAAQ